MHAAFRDGIRSPGGMACEIGIAGGVLLWLFWWIGRDSGVGVFGGLISILGLSITVFTAEIVWELRTQHVRHVMMRDSFERLEELGNEVRAHLVEKDLEGARKSLGTILGSLERLSRHVKVIEDDQQLLEDLREALRADRRSFPRKAFSLLPQIDRCVEILRAMLLELESGGRR
jgi:hypothetical protein